MPAQLTSTSSVDMSPITRAIAAVVADVGRDRAV
jgi:hypothetical protein